MQPNTFRRVTAVVVTAVVLTLSAQGAAVAADPQWESDPQWETVTPTVSRS